MLAFQTARANREIAAQILAIRSATVETVDAVRDVCSVITRIEEVAGAIAACVQQQTAATQEIAGTAHTMRAATTRTAASMQEVLKVSDDAGKTSRVLLAVAEDVGRSAHTLGSDIKLFVPAMEQCDDMSRRRYERVAGEGETATLLVSQEPARRLVISNISRSGVMLHCDWDGVSGTAVQIQLPGSVAPVEARVVRVPPG